MKRHILSLFFILPLLYLSSLSCMTESAAREHEASIEEGLEQERMHEAQVNYYIEQQKTLFYQQPTISALPQAEQDSLWTKKQAELSTAISKNLWKKRTQQVALQLLLEGLPGTKVQWWRAVEPILTQDSTTWKRLDLDAVAQNISNMVAQSGYQFSLTGIGALRQQMLPVGPLGDEESQEKSLKELQRRANILKTLSTNDKLFYKLEELLKTFKEYEYEYYAFFNRTDPLIANFELYRAQSTNQSWWSALETLAMEPKRMLAKFGPSGAHLGALLIISAAGSATYLGLGATAIGIGSIVSSFSFSPMALFGLPAVGISTYQTLQAFVPSVNFPIKQAWDTYKASISMHYNLKSGYERLIRMGELIKVLININTELRSLVKEFKGNELQDLEDFLIKVNTALKNPQATPLAELITSLTTQQFAKKEVTHASTIWDANTVLKNFLGMIDFKGVFLPAMQSLGYVDVYVGLAKLLRTLKGQEITFSIPEFIKNAPTPEIRITNGWTPLIDIEEAVPNSIELGGSYARNAFFAGAHGAGKSMMKREVLHAIILGQGLAISPAEHSAFTPYGLFRAYINVTDQLGLSSHMAEEFYLKITEQFASLLTTNEFGLILVDEPYAKTKQWIAEKRAIEFIHRLSKLPNITLLFSSHLEETTKEVIKLSESFRVFHPEVIESVPGMFELTYRILPNVDRWWFEDKDKQIRYTTWLSKKVGASFEEHKEQFSDFMELEKLKNRSGFKKREKEIIPAKAEHPLPEDESKSRASAEEKLKASQESK